MSKQRDLVGVAQEAGASGYVNATGDTMTGTYSFGGFISLQTSDNNGYPRINGNSSSAQLGLFRATGGTEGGFYLGGDGSQFSVWSSDFVRRMNVNTSGHVTMPYQPAFVAFMSANHTTTTNGQLPFDSLSTEIPSQRSTGYSTANRRFTAPATGLYQFSVSLDFAGNYSNFYFWCGINGGGRYRDFFENVDVLANGGFYSTFSIHMTAGDYIQLHAGSAGIALYGGNAAYNCVWQGHLIS